MSKTLHKIIALIFLMGLQFFALQTVDASGMFPKNTYSIPAGKSILLNPTPKSGAHIEWSVEKEKIATIDSNGIACGITPGKTTVYAKNKSNKTVSTCTLEVLNPEPIRTVYTTPNIVTIDSNFQVYIITNKNAESAKFEIYGPNCARTEYCGNKETEDSTFKWCKKTSVSAPGTYTINAFAKISGSWKACDSATTDILVVKTTGKTKVSLKPRRVSDDCVSFISSAEGVRLKAYKDLAGNLTIGYGNHIWPFDPFYNNITMSEAFAMFAKSLNKGSFANSVNKFLINNQIKFNQHQFDALVSFTYNLGPAWLYNNCPLAKVLLHAGVGSNAGQTLFGTVTSSNGVNLRETPGASSKRIGGIGHRVKVEILDSKKHNENWYRVKTPDGTIGYCYSDFLEISRESTGGKNLNSVNKEKLISEFSAYHHMGKKCSQSLLLRRFHELDIFLHGKYSRFRAWKYVYNYPMPECAVKSGVV